MNTKNLKELYKDGHKIGLHSNNHFTNFNKLDSKTQKEEYQNNKFFIEKKINEEVTSMSHPCGRYNNSTLEILKKLGIRIGFRSSMFPPVIKSPLEVPIEDHSNIVKLLNI